FFRIGGDSILSIQASSRIRQLGYPCQVKDIFTYKTIDRLSSYLSSETLKISIDSEQGLLEGELGLLPIQRWFTNQSDQGLLPKAGHWNQSFMMTVPSLDTDTLKGVLQKIVDYHDILRVQYQQKGTLWKQYYKDTIEIPEIKSVDINQYSDSELQDILTEWQSDFDLEQGPLFRMGYLYGYDEGKARIFFALHHIIVDAVSWRILSQDIKTLYKGESLPEKGSSYRQWVDVMESYVTDNPKESSYWSEQLLNIPDYFDFKSITAEPSSATLSLSKTETSFLLQESSKTYHTEVNDLLLTALAYALKELNKTNLQGITLEGHGREDIHPSIDHSHTVGWFTAMFPVRLVIEDTIEQSIREIKENLRNIPNKGIGFGAFALDADTNYGYQDLAAVSFNYLGQF
ncbi:condensation domain-containing protein, partial [uncultured Aquimarina sp.]|uniref:condensation domain-containing protein n=1 Tax=uncultured Aquimarina sp. TaxID=575652 RepID=UPI00261DB735